MTIKRFFQLLIFSIIISILSVITIEVTLSIIFPEKVTLFKSAAKLNNEYPYRFDPLTIVELKPNISNFSIVPEGKRELIKWHTNESHYRVDAVTVENGKRIVIYGDSFIHGTFSHDTATFASQIQKQLFVNTNRMFNVINRGLTGAGPDQNYLRLKNDLESLKPDLVLFAVLAENDLGDILKNKLFKLDSVGALRRTYIPVNEKTAEMPVWISTRQKITQMFLTTRLIKKTIDIIVGSDKIKVSEVKNQINDLRNLCEKEYILYKNPSSDRFPHFGDHPDFDIMEDIHDESSILKIRLLSSILKEVKACVSRLNIPLVIVIIPAAIDLADIYRINYKVLKEMYPGYSPDRLSRIVDSLCVVNYVDKVNLFKTFIDNSPNELYFGEEDNHWNAKGQRLAAETVIRHLLDQGYFKNTKLKD